MEDTLDDIVKMGIIDIGPECFASGDLRIISYKGENYYQSCGEVVNETKTGTSHCVKRVGHGTSPHEDFFGTTRENNG